MYKLVKIFGYVIYLLFYRIIPNYIAGFATDLYACRFFLNIPWKIGNAVLESNIKFIYGSPHK